MRRRGNQEGNDRERGAALVEFALVVPLFLSLMLGILTGGLAWNQRISLTNASREAARYGATLPTMTGMTTWLDTVAAVAVSSAEGNLASGVAGRSICVAYVYPAGITTTDRTTSRTESGSTVTYGNTPCYADGQPTTVRRVQVVLRRRSRLQTAVFTRDLDLTGRVVVRFEAAEQ